MSRKYKFHNPSAAYFVSFATLNFIEVSINYQERDARASVGFHSKINMKYKIITLVTFLLFLSCKENTRNITSSNILKKMLANHYLVKEQFNDSLSLKVFDGWGSFPLQKNYSDSSLTYYPSSIHNPTYSLVTNYKKNFKLRDSMVFFNFIDHKKKRLHLGLLSKKDENAIFDFCWTKDSVFYLLEKSNSEYYLRKYTMKNDTVKYYIIR